MSWNQKRFISFLLICSIIVSFAAAANGDGFRYIHVEADRIMLNNEILFKNQSAEISSVSHPALNEVATLLENDNRFFKIRVENHSSDAATSKKNLALSEKRAQSIVDYLVKAGIEEKRLIAFGHGDSLLSEEPAKVSSHVAFIITEQYDREKIIGQISSAAKDVHFLSKEKKVGLTSGASIQHLSTIETGPDAFAKTQVGDHEIAIEQNARVTFVDPLLSEDKSYLSIARLEQGAIQVQVQPKKSENGFTRFVVSTGAGDVALIGGQASILAELDGQIVINNLGSETVFIYRGEKDVVDVPAGYGLRMRSNLPPEKPRVLPERPQFHARQKNAFPTLGDSGVLKIRWNKIAGSAKYVVTIDDLSKGVRQMMTVPGADDTLIVPNISAGQYFVKMTAIDQSGLESPASRRLDVVVESLKLQSAWAADKKPDGLHLTAIVGDVLLIEDKNTRCQDADWTSEDGRLALREGRRLISCTRGEGTTFAPLVIDVLRPVVSTIQTRNWDNMTAVKIGFVGGERFKWDEFDVITGEDDLVKSATTVQSLKENPAELSVLIPKTFEAGESTKVKLLRHGVEVVTISDVMSGYIDETGPAKRSSLLKKHGWWPASFAIAGAICTTALTIASVHGDRKADEFRDERLGGGLSVDETSESIERERRYRDASTTDGRVAIGCGALTLAGAAVAIPFFTYGE